MDTINEISNSCNVSNANKRIANMENVLHSENGEENAQKDGEHTTTENHRDYLMVGSIQETQGINTYTEDRQRLTSMPDIVHVIESGTNSPLMYHLRGAFYVPLIRCNVFYPHWLQDMMDRDIWFHLHPITKDGELPMQCKEGHHLLKRIRNLFGRFSWNSSLPVCLQLQLAENYGNTRLPRRHRLKPLFASSLYVDHRTTSAVFKGAKFSLAIGVPFLSDLENNMDDPGAAIDIGLYVRNLETNPGVKVRWYIYLQRKELPMSAINSAKNEGGINSVDIDI